MHTSDLVILKAFADRSRDWADIEGVLIRSGHRLEWRTVEAELEPFCGRHILLRFRRCAHQSNSPPWRSARSGAAINPDFVFFRV